jgi:glycosyltransferase involved in cell wall biosynthesis
MKILLYCPFSFNLFSNNLIKIGGIETLNYELAQKLAKINKLQIYLATDTKKIITINNIKNLPIKDLDKIKINFDAIISSNYSKIFNNFPNSKKIYWMHNTLSFEKALRKKILFSLLFNKVKVVFVSKYLNNITSNLYLFNKRMVIPNFLSSTFVNLKRNYSRKKIFVWSVKRDRGLKNVIDIWIKKIHPTNPEAKLYIYGINKKLFRKDLNFYKKNNIYFFGLVEKRILKKIYNKSLAMICLGYDETFCLNALEANACGLPIITFGHTALKDFTFNNKNGYLVNNYDQLANKINDLCNSKINKDIINYSYNYSKKFDIEKIVNKWINLLKK